MKELQQYINSFSLLGDFIEQFLSGNRSEEPKLEEVNNLHYKAFGKLISEANHYNPWFTEPFVREALNGIRILLRQENLKIWLSNYPDLEKKKSAPRQIGVVMAGNIPLVGFHDFLCVLLTGNSIIGKPASRDEHLIRAIAGALQTIDPSFSEKITLVNDYLSDIDAVIATGSDNTARYFNYYFREIPRIIRKNRNSIAVLTGTETDEQLLDLGKDIFTYFGLGCRNVTKLYVPETFDLLRIMRLFESYNYLYDHHKYANNIDHYRTIYLMNRESFLDNGAMLLKEDHGLSSPVGVVYYEKYSDIEILKQTLVANRDILQCIVSVDPGLEGSILPGTSQRPLPWEYADRVDTLRFLIEI